MWGLNLFVCMCRRRRIPHTQSVAHATAFTSRTHMRTYMVHPCVLTHHPTHTTDHYHAINRRPRHRHPLLLRLCHEASPRRSVWRLVLPRGWSTRMGRKPCTARRIELIGSRDHEAERSRSHVCPRSTKIRPAAPPTYGWVRNIERHQPNGLNFGKRPRV